VSAADTQTTQRDMDQDTARAILAANPIPSVTESLREWAAGLDRLPAPERQFKRLEKIAVLDYLGNATTLVDSVLAERGNGSRSAPATPADAAQAESLSFITAAELATVQPEAVDYLCPPYFARGTVVDLTGKTKGGKSTFAAALCRAVLTGEGFLDGTAVKAPVIYATEERQQTFRAALLRAGIGDSPDLHILFRFRTGTLAWTEVAEQIARQAREVGAGLVVIDTLGDWAGLVGEQENDAGFALAAVRPLHMLAAGGPAVLMLRHERKSGGEIGDSGRGSSAFAGAADMLLSLCYQRGEGHDNRRVLHARGRFDDIPQRVVIDYAKGRYELLGDEMAIARRDARLFLLESLPGTEDQAATIAMLADEVGDRVSRATVQRALTELVNEGIACRRKGAGNASAKAPGYWLVEMPS
jgi:hypothetical protein